MFIYWAIFVVLATGALLSQEPRPRPTRFLLFALAALPTALMIGLRWKIGPDWIAYDRIYKYSALFSFGQNLALDDPGFKILCWGLQQLHAPFWTLNAISGLIFVAGLSAFCLRQPNPWLAYLLAFPYLVIVVAMSGDRQSIALGLLFFSLNAFERGHLYRFALCILAAGLFHGSALLMLPVCLLSHTKNRVQRLLLLIAFALLAVHFFEDTFSIYARRYSRESIQSAGVAYRLAMNSLAAVIYLLFERRFDLDQSQSRLWRNISFCTLGLIPLLAFVPSSTAIDRFLLYLFPLQFVVLGRLPRALFEDRQMRGLLTFLVIAYAAAVQATFLFFGSFAQYYVPYHSILDR